MKKYFFPILMGVVILFGVVLTFTPWVADYLMPVKETHFRRAPAPEAQEALANWFNVKTSDIQYPEGLQFTSPERKIAWFKFHIARVPVEQFIKGLQLEQKDLTPQVLQEKFLTPKPPAEWWKPEELTRQSYFTSSAKGQELSLIYNAEVQQGYLLVNTLILKESQPN